MQSLKSYHATGRASSSRQSQSNAHAGSVPSAPVLRGIPISASWNSTTNSLAAGQPVAPRTSRASRRLVQRALASAAPPPVTYAPPQAQTLVLDVPGGAPITLATGEIGRQANGAIWATCGETVLYATACCAPVPTGDGSFVPFTVNYAERFSAAGRTSGGYIKRDGRPKDAEVLTSRLVDRPLRPMFAKGWSNDTQVLEWVLSYDGLNEPEPIAITAAAAALLISDIPLKKAIAGVRVGMAPDGSFIVNPTTEAMKTSRLDLMVAGTKDAILMIEGFCDFLSEETMIEALRVGSQAIASLCSQMEAWAAKVGKPKRTDSVVTVPDALVERLKGLVAEQLKKAYRTSLSKEVRSSAVGEAQARAQAVLAAESEAPAYTPLQISMALKAVESEVMRSLVLEEQLRADGRGVRDIRPITSRCSLLPRTHGSSLFTRGETQAVCVATLGSASDALRQESIRRGDDEEHDRFYLQYHFPPSSVGETGRTGAPGRRELGHGELAQRALAPIVPPEEAFPYTIRVESTITESNGSSSMASVCGGCLAMMDAGVPLARPVAGIAMGLILEAGRHVVLSDILGSEDALGDMDFKVAGDYDAITAFQMDIKVEGITLDIMASALQQAKEGRRHILGEMAKASPGPRGELSPYAPRLLRMQIDPSKKGAVIGAGGKVIKQLLEASGASAIDIDDDGKVNVVAPSLKAAEMAAEFVGMLAADPEPGTIFRAKPVAGLAAFGCFVELCPGRQGLVHVSEMGEGPLGDPAAAVKVGDKVDVMVLSADGGKLSLSIKAVAKADAGEAVAMPKRVFANSSSDGGRGGGRGRGGGGRGGGDRMRRP